MNNLKRIVLLSLLTIPSIAFAHGEEVLVTIFLQFVVLIAIIAGVLIVKLNWTGKLIVGAMGILAIALADIATKDLPYVQHKTLINVVVTFLPLTIVVLSFIVLRRKLNKDS